MDAVKIYGYLVQVRERVLEAAAGLSEAEWGRELRIGLNTVGATLTHLMISEWYYVERMEGRAVEPYERWPIRYEAPHTPGRALVERTWREQWARVRGVVAVERDWKRTVTWLGFPDDTRGMKRFQISTTAGDIFTQLVLHEVHHRSQVMAMLREAGRPVQDVDYNALMWERVEAE